MEDCLMAKEWRGCIAIPMTPFDADDRIKEDDLCAEIYRVWDRLQPFLVLRK
jgi:hypothetical protein